LIISCLSSERKETISTLFKSLKRNQSNRFVKNPPKNVLKEKTSIKGVDYSGKCGNNINWEIDKYLSNILVINKDQSKYSIWSEVFDMFN